jgi:hypothetical protein
VDKPQPSTNHRECSCLPLVADFDLSGYEFIVSESVSALSLSSFVLSRFLQYGFQRRVKDYPQSFY